MVKTVLVIGGNPNLNWFEVFKDEKLHGKEDVLVDMAMWDEIHLVSYSDGGLVVTLSPAANPVVVMGN